MKPKLVHHILEESAARYPKKVALICGEKRLTYQDINDQADVLASSLFQLGIKPHDRVVIYLDNSVESVIAMFAILKAGGIFVIVNASLKPKKLGYILKDTGAKILISVESKADVVCSSADENFSLKHIVWVARKRKECKDRSPSSPIKIESHSWNDLFGVSPGTVACCSKIIDVDLAALIYTSGTSGFPKGVMSAHYNILAAVESIDQYLHHEQNDIILNMLPLSFDYGLYQIFLAFYVSATVVLAEGSSYPYQVIELLKKEKITGFPIVPTIAAILSKMRNGDGIKYKSLRYLTNTGDRLTFSMTEKLRTLFPNADIFKMYGLTECKRATYLPPDQITKRPDSVGIPIPNSQAFILDEAGMEVGPNKVGELVVRGSHVMQGYWNSKDNTERVFKRSDHRADALLYTGDLFKRDEEGFLYFIGRKDDLLKVKGERVSPKEIENYLDSMPDVMQSAVIGLPDDLYGHLIVSFVIPNDGLQLDPKNILRQCQKNLEPHFIPHEIIILVTLPTNGNGKVDKNLLIEKSKSIIKTSNNRPQRCKSERVSESRRQG